MHIDIYNMDLKFEWDPDKADRNWQRHKIRFEEAVEAFFDPSAVEDYDIEHSLHEPRYNLIGLSSRRLLFIVYAEPGKGVIRIISARKAEGKYRKIYES